MIHRIYSHSPLHFLMSIISMYDTWRWPKQYPRLCLPTISMAFFVNLAVHANLCPSTRKFCKLTNINMPQCAKYPAHRMAIKKNDFQFKSPEMAGVTRSSDLPKSLNFCIGFNSFSKRFSRFKSGYIVCRNNDCCVL